jgi:uncharacterized protein (TIGR03435 family)
MTLNALDKMYDSRPLGWLPIKQTKLTLKNRSLAGLVASAYRVRLRQVSGPAWATQDRYDVEAILPAGTPHETVNDMLRTLLEERFGLKVHCFEREESGKGIVESKGGAMLKPAAPAGNEPDDPMSEEDRRAAVEKMKADTMRRLGEIRREAASNHTGSSEFFTWQRSATLAELADWLTPIIEQPVADATGLLGKYDFDLFIRRFGDETNEYATGQALSKLGLKLVTRKITGTMVVIDQAERTPKPN